MPSNYFEFQLKNTEGHIQTNPDGCPHTPTYTEVTLCNYVLFASGGLDHKNKGTAYWCQFAIIVL